METTTLPDGDACYRALETHDVRFDGQFFVGVATTGIYCRVVCPAKTPRRENCTFYPSAAAAERAGHRPCLRCRPELAPGCARVDAAERLASAAASRIEDGALTEKSVEALAAELGVSDRHLRRVVEDAFGVSPVELAQTQRLLLAKRLLTDTALPVTEVAYASGFASLSRFNTLFRDRYRMNPTDLRRQASAGGAAVAKDRAETLRCEIAYRPPLDWPGLLAFVAGRASRGVESAGEGGTYRRTARVGKLRGWLTVAPSARRADTLTVEVSASLAPALPAVLSRVKRLFDLAAEPRRIAAHLGPLAAENPGLRVPGAFDPFEMAVRAVLGQQVSVKAATTLSGRFAAALGDPIETPYPELSHLSPTPERVAATESEQLTALGITRARVATILALARAVSDGDLSLEPGGDPAGTVARLKELPGIGEWTAQYVAMRALSWPDAFPHTDLGVYKALGTRDPKRVLEIAEAWRPWRAYAVMHLWKSLEEEIER